MWERVAVLLAHNGNSEEELEYGVANEGDVEGNGKDAESDEDETALSCRCSYGMRMVVEDCGKDVVDNNYPGSEGDIRGDVRYSISDNV